MCLIVCFHCGHQCSYQTATLWHCHTFLENAALLISPRGPKDISFFRKYEVFALTCSCKTLSWHWLYLKIMTRFSSSWPSFSFSMGPVDPSVEIPGKNTGLLLVMKECIGYYMWHRFIWFQVCLNFIQPVVSDNNNLPVHRSRLKTLNLRITVTWAHIINICTKPPILPENPAHRVKLSPQLAISCRLWPKATNLGTSA